MWATKWQNDEEMNWFRESVLLPPAHIQKKWKIARKQPHTRQCWPWTWGTVQDLPLGRLQGKEACKPWQHTTHYGTAAHQMTASSTSCKAHCPPAHQNGENTQYMCSCRNRSWKKLEMKTRTPSYVNYTDMYIQDVLNLNLSRPCCCCRRYCCCCIVCSNELMHAGVNVTRCHNMRMTNQKRCISCQEYGKHQAIGKLHIKIRQDPWLDAPVTIWEAQSIRKHKIAYS